MTQLCTLNAGDPSSRAVWLLRELETDRRCWKYSIFISALSRCWSPVTILITTSTNDVTAAAAAFVSTCVRVCVHSTNYKTSVGVLAV